MSDQAINKNHTDGFAQIPYSVYHDVDIYNQEQEKIFRGPCWSYLALEAELPDKGDYKSTYIGDSPIVVTRDQEGDLHAWVNRCAHKGALVCRESRGNSTDSMFTCVYHQWAYNAEGELLAVPFRKGLQGSGGYAKDFEIKKHGLKKIQLEIFHGMVFGSFDESPPSLETYLGDKMCDNIARILHRPIKILGYARQYMQGNWKLYSENSRDSYHGGLLHLFYPTFGIYRQSQESEGVVSKQGFHNVFNVKVPTEKIDIEKFSQQANREMQGVEKLQDPRVIQYIPDMNDGIGLSIQSLFPSVVLQQIQNTLATRQVLPKKVNGTELVWTYFGYEDDSEEMRQHRLRNINLVGPAGFISMEDGEAVELCQNGMANGLEEQTYIQMGGKSVEETVAPIGMDENAVRGFWKGYQQIMAS